MTGARAIVAAAGLAAAAAPAAADEARGDEARAGEADDADAPIVPDDRAVRAAREANLEPTRRREGLALGVAVGPTIQVGFGIEEASGNGGSFDVRIGTSASDRLAWFVDVFLAGLPREGDTGRNKLNQSAFLTGGGQLFLLEALWLRAGAGFSSLTLRSEESQGDAVTFNGLGVLVGGGIDFLRRGRFALSGGLTILSGVYADGFVSSGVLQLALTWY